MRAVSHATRAVSHAARAFLHATRAVSHAAACVFACCACVFACSACVFAEPACDHAELARVFVRLARDHAWLARDHAWLACGSAPDDKRNAGRSFSPLAFTSGELGMTVGAAGAPVVPGHGSDRVRRRDDLCPARCVSAPLVPARRRHDSRRDASGPKAVRRRNRALHAPPTPRGEDAAGPAAGTAALREELTRTPRPLVIAANCRVSAFSEAFDIEYDRA
jgi:hypothetical protein